MKPHSRFLVAVSLLACGACSAGSAEPPPRNLSLGASYAYSPEARYHLTRDPSDHSALTDGHYATGRFWEDREATVGWQKSGTIRVDLDLGSASPIGKVCVSTARGKEAGVFFPRRIDLFTSTDGKNFADGGAIGGGSPLPEGNYRIDKFCSSDLNLYSRYITLFMQPKGGFTFLDEIEVWSGSPGRASVTTELIDIENLPALHDQRVALGIEKKVMKEMAGTLGLPWNGEGGEEGLYRAAAKSARNRLPPKLILWHEDPWQPFSPLSLPSDANNPLPFTFELMIGGADSSALNLTNLTADAQTVLFTVEGPAASLVSVREAKAVGVASDESYRADALLSLPREGLVIRPGESRQIWLTARDNKNANGVTKGFLRLTDRNSGKLISVIPISVKVFDVEPSQQVSPRVVTWSYLNSAALVKRPEAAIDDLRAHGTNVFVLHPSELPRFSVGKKDGNVDFKQFDRSIRLFGRPGMFLFFFNFNAPELRNQFGYPFPSPDWQHAVSRWVVTWVAHLKNLGLTPDDYAFYPVDEPKGKEEARILIETASLIKRIDPRLQVYTTLGELDGAELKRAMEVVDIFQVLSGDLDSRRVRELRDASRDFWAYSAEGGGKHAHPHEFYRLQAWRAFRAGATGVGFWAYADTGPSGTAWDDFDGTRPDYAVIYEGKDEIISSKRWEAWREGVEDYCLLSLARSKLRNKMEKAQFQALVDRVISHPKDYQGFQETRRWLLEVASRRP